MDMGRLCGCAGGCVDLGWLRGFGVTAWIWGGCEDTGTPEAISWLLGLGGVKDRVALGFLQRPRAPPPSEAPVVPPTASLCRRPSWRRVHGGSTLDREL